MTPSQETAELAVTRDDATRFLENAVRNWSHVPPLSNDDLDDVAGALKGFLAKRRAALDSAQQPAPVGDAALRKATDELAAFATLLERPPLDDVEIEAQLAARIAASIRALLATPPAPASTVADNGLREALSVARQHIIDHAMCDGIVELIDRALSTPATTTTERGRG